MPGLHHPVTGPLGGDGEAVKLARQADGEVANVDHLLDLAEPFLEDLPGLEADEPAERLLLLPQDFAEEPHELAAAGRRNIAPGEEGLVGAGHGGGDILGRGRRNSADRPAVYGRAGFEIPLRRSHAEPLEQRPRLTA